jgi:large subunit ribosomal protein L4e
MASARPVVSVLDSADGTTVKSSLKLPEVFTAPIRLDVVQHVQRDMAKNKRQAYAVSLEAGTFFLLDFTFTSLE